MIGKNSQKMEQQNSNIAFIIKKLHSAKNMLMQHPFDKREECISDLFYAAMTLYKLERQLNEAHACCEATIKRVVTVQKKLAGYNPYRHKKHEYKLLQANNTLDTLLEDIQRWK